MKETLFPAEAPEATPNATPNSVEEQQAAIKNKLVNYLGGESRRATAELYLSLYARCIQLAEAYEADPRADIYTINPYKALARGMWGNHYDDFDSPDFKNLPPGKREMRYQSLQRLQRFATSWRDQLKPREIEKAVLNKEAGVDDRALFFGVLNALRPELSHSSSRQKILADVYEFASNYYWAAGGVEPAPPEQLCEARVPSAYVPSPHVPAAY